MAGVGRRGGLLPRISIVTPSFNQGPFVEWTVRSVLLQGYPDLEYVVMDGGSSDDTMARLEPYRDRLHHLESVRDGGQADALARGFERTTGEIMAYLNSDDVLAPGALEFVAAFFERNPFIDVVYSHRCRIDAQGTVIGYWVLPPHLDYLMLRWDLIPQETCFWRRRLFERAGPIDRTLHFAIDYDLFVRFMAHGRLARANRFLGAFREHGDAKTTRIERTVGKEEVERIRNRYAIEVGSNGDYLGDTFLRFVRRAGERHAAAARVLPGALPGIGYGYDDVWGGRLAQGPLGS